MLYITDTIAIDERELAFEFVRASGPGGQSVNKLATAVQLRFDLGACEALSDPVRERAAKLAGRRLTSDGIVIIMARRYRTQDRNRKDAVDRLVTLLRRAANPPRPRRKTRRTRASVERRLEAKRRRSRTKRLRGKGPEDG